MVAYLNRAKSENLGFNDVCLSLSNFKNLGSRQQKIVKARDVARNNLFSLSELESETQAKISSFLQSGSSEDRNRADYAASMEFLTPLLQRNFVNQLVDVC
jgi:hypothetical protein